LQEKVDEQGDRRANQDIRGKQFSIREKHSGSVIHGV
jgi:hypothetical protein